MTPLRALHVSVCSVASSCFSVWSSSIAWRVQPPGCTCNVYNTFPQSIANRGIRPGIPRRLWTTGRCLLAEVCTTVLHPPLVQAKDGWLLQSSSVQKYPTTACCPICLFVYIFIYFYFNQFVLTLNSRVSLVLSSWWAFKWGKNTQETFYLLWGGVIFY